MPYIPYIIGGVVAVLAAAGGFIAGLIHRRKSAEAAIGSAEERPWIWWFWLGNIVSEELINQHLTAYSKAGLPSWEKNGKNCLHKRRRRKRHFFPIY